MRQIGLIVFAIELIGFGIWSTVAWDRYSLTNDFWLLYAPISQISHSGFGASLHIISEHFDAVILWPLAWLVELPLHGLLLSYAQDIAVVTAGLVGFFWVCEMLERSSDDKSIRAYWLAALALLLLVGDPWIFLTPAFDVHLEAFGTVFIVLAARALYRRRVVACLVWVAATLTCGFVAATYVAGLAVGALVSGGKKQRLVGMGLLVAGVLGVLALTEVGQGAGFLTGTYGYLAGPEGSQKSLLKLALHLITHPGKALSVLWSERVHIFANLAPAGLLGLFWGWGAGIVVVVMLSNMLQSVENLKSPSYQGLPIYVFVAIGTVIVLGRLSRRKVNTWDRGIVSALAAVVAAQTVGWAATWTPKLPGSWLRVSPAAAQVLSRIDRMIPTNAPVIASQGVVGRFASHPDSNELTYGVGVGLPGETRPIWVVITPQEGIETTTPSLQESLVTELAQEGQARIIAHGHGVWGIEWSPPETQHYLGAPPPTAPIGGWVIPGPAGRTYVAGPAKEWAAVSTGRRGYVANGDYFKRGLGTYKASVKLFSSGPSVVEAWNITGNVLLDRFTVSDTHGQSLVSFPVTVSHLYPHTEVYSGWGPFSFTPPFIPGGNTIELRVWQPGNSQVRVYSLSLS